MKDRKSEFFAFRYLVTPISNQVSIYHQMDKSKEELMKEIVYSLNFNSKTEWSNGNKRYLIYGFQQKNDFFILKYARETNQKIYVEGDSDIEVKGIKETKFVYLIIDIEHQLILIEKNTAVFSSVKSAINTLASYFRDKMKDYDYVVNIYPLVSKKSFWKYIEEADSIYELKLVLNAPNMPFFGDANTRSVLQKIKDTTNNEEVEIALRNKEGGLQIKVGVVGNIVNYVLEVGGKYVLKISKNGLDYIKTSYDNVAKTYISHKKSETYSEEELEDINNTLNLIHNLDSREEE